MTELRICSLLPSATEIICALGLGDKLVAVTHECDYPPQVEGLPQVTKSLIFSQNMTAREVDDAVKKALANLSTIYEIDRDMLSILKPSLIVTQELCEVCAVSFGQVQEAARSICTDARLVSLEPNSLADIFDTIQQVGHVCHVEEEARRLSTNLVERCTSIRLRVGDTYRPRILALEWLDPPFSAGHWVPEMIEVAGGVPLLSHRGERSRELTWSEVAGSRPEVVILMPCGYDLQMTLRQLRRPLPSELDSLLAPGVEAFAVNGSAYFNRPGPRVVDGIEILAQILHPEEFGSPPSDQSARIELPISL